MRRFRFEGGSVIPDENGDWCLAANVPAADVVKTIENAAPYAIQMLRHAYPQGSSAATELEKAVKSLTVTHSDKANEHPHPCVVEIGRLCKMCELGGNCILAATEKG